MRLPGGKVVCDGLPPGGGAPTPAGGAPTPVKRVSSEAPGRAVKRVLSSLVPRSSLMTAIHAPRAEGRGHAPIRVLPAGQCKDRHANATGRDQRSRNVRML